MKKTYSNPELFGMICGEDVITASGVGVIFDFQSGNKISQDGERSI